MEASFESPEEMREVILTQHRQIETLHREINDAELLLEALKALLNLDDDTDPFVGVFEVLAPVYQFSHAVLLVERETAEGQMRCIVSTDEELEDTIWIRGSLFTKVLDGRVIATVAPHPEVEWPDAVVRHGLNPDQPALYLPVGFRDRRGLLMLLRSVGSPGFDRDDKALARKLSLLASHAFASRMANRTENERRRLHHLTEELRSVQEELANRAFSDQLTGLPNRSSFEEKVADVLERVAPGQRLALAFIDLDGFKQVNDHYGHEIGDELLSAVAGRLHSHIRTSDTVARMSGDEFVMLLNPICDTDELDAVIARVLASLAEPFQIAGHDMMVSASIGLAVFPDHGRDCGQLLRNADMAMYSAKSSTRGRAAHFEPELSKVAAIRSWLEQDLRRAVAEDRFCSVVQPKIDLRTMKVKGFESLARQLDSDGDLVSSADFVDLATHLGLLDRITELVVDDITTALPLLDSAFGDKTTMSINLSTRQATNPGRLRSFLDQLARTSRPERFILEVTEDALMEIDIFQNEILPLIGEFGVQVSIDDFGSGYASLSRLLNTTVHEVKVDRSFITAVQERPRSQIILRAVSEASHELGLDLVAEGVETVGELEYLLTHTQIRIAQGNLFSPPMTPEQAVAEAASIAERLADFQKRPLRTSGIPRL